MSDRGDRRVCWLHGNAINPAPDGRKAAEIEVAFVGYVRVCVQRDIGDRIRIVREPIGRREATFHHAERGGITLAVAQQV